MHSKMTKGLFAGSFDPFTIGHASIVERAAAIFDRIVVAVGYNEHKSGMYGVAERVEAIRRLYAGDPRVEVESFTGLTVDFARRCGATALVRGVRGSSDFEFERNLADTNAAIADLETVLLISRPELAFVSSSMVRELIHNGYDASRYIAAPIGCGAETHNN